MDSSSNPLIHLPPEVIARTDPAVLKVIALQQARIELLEARIEELLAQLGNKFVKFGQTTVDDEEPKNGLPALKIRPRKRG